MTQFQTKGMEERGRGGGGGGGGGWGGGGGGGARGRPNLPMQWIVKLQNKQILMPTRWPGNAPLNCFFFDA